MKDVFKARIRVKVTHDSTAKRCFGVEKLGFSSGLLRRYDFALQ
jgi:hypothetical protein